MFDLKLKEAKQFRELTGMGVEQLAQKMGTQLCQPHRLAIRHCKDCRLEKKPMCEAHMEAFQACDKCVGMNLPEDVLGALVLIYRRREQPELTMEQLEDEMPYLEMLGYLGNAMGSQSTPSSSPGSRPSATGSRGSRRRASAS